MSRDDLRDGLLGRELLPIDAVLEGASLVDDRRPAVMADVWSIMACRSGVDALGRPGRELRRRSISAARSRKKPPELARWKDGRGHAVASVELLVVVVVVVVDVAVVHAAVDAVLRRRLSEVKRSLSMSPSEPSLALRSGLLPVAMRAESAS